ncbi:hypothetical protein L211DRAFT_864855 [Terfezia boudieri ATCC MYA-4762]|uniref:Uncharacterized protein n=1 Tax=Terfezia boudieri ATCC MYA-4762 TaxID=1051890 RepID=A0A3N4LZ65_9PEZI|nr:hypothetical protein L211DRAFT_864855 [Terfezia boudieri ATCC MYA-4762]
MKNLYSQISDSLTNYHPPCGAHGVLNERSNFSPIEQKRLSLEKTSFSVNDLKKDLQKLCTLSLINDNIKFNVVDGLRPKPSSKSASILSSISEQFDIEEIFVGDLC